MKLDTATIHKMLLQAFPDLHTFSRGNPQYEVWPTLDEVVDLVKQIGPIRDLFKTEEAKAKAQCEHYALAFHDELKRWFPHRFTGEIWGPQIRDKGNHTANIVIIEPDRIVLFEPQKVGFWWAPTKDDKVLLVRTA